MLVYQDVCYKTRSCSFSQSIVQNASINGPRVSGNLANDNHQGKCSFPNELLFGEIDHKRGLNQKPGYKYFAWKMQTIPEWQGNLK